MYQPSERSNIMSTLASFSRSQTISLLDRLLAILERILQVNAEISARNGDLPYFGL